MKAKTRITLGWLLGLVPAAILLYAALLKGLDPRLFADQITAHRVTPAAWSAFLAPVVVFLEIAIGLALALRLWPRFTHFAFLAMMIGFIAITAYAWSQGNAKECGCFGRAVGRGPTAVLVQDSLLIVVSLVAMRLERGARTSARLVAAGAVLLLPSLAFSIFGGKMPAQSLVTGIRSGSSLADLPIEDLRRPHTEGWALLLLVGPDCPACREGLPDLSALARNRKDVAVAAVYSGPRQEAMAWRLENLPAFPVAHASARALRAYYRELPTAFLSKDGALVQAWWGRLPHGAEVEAKLPPAS
ncbi:MAG: MauE/DoxX family redox-associated membrane protein [Candidatus Eisenbacteria bacterium]|nr:hypothetical protein [Candidatus Eisenbacteria bacterium]